MGGICRHTVVSLLGQKSWCFSREIPWIAESMVTDLGIIVHLSNTS